MPLTYRPVVKPKWAFASVQNNDWGNLCWYGPQLLFQHNKWYLKEIERQWGIHWQLTWQPLQLVPQCEWGKQCILVSGRLVTMLHTGTYPLLSGDTWRGLYLLSHTDPLRWKKHGWKQVGADLKFTLESFHISPPPDVVYLLSESRQIESILIKSNCCLPDFSPTDTFIQNMSSQHQERSPVDWYDGSAVTAWVMCAL